MSSHLERIIAHKRTELEQYRQSLALPSRATTLEYTLASQIEAHKGRALISEMKRASPSKGELNMQVNPIEQAKKYANAGASAISVLTDETFFKGSLHDLRAIREVVDVPLLCKDFVVDPIQIDAAKHHGANIILLIVAALTDAELKNLYDYATALKLEVLVEVHNEEELRRANVLKPKLLGINNRNLKTFEEDLSTTAALIPLVYGPEALVVSESGVRSVADAQYVGTYGARAILVGEALMRAEDPVQLAQDLQYA
ncbi:MAG: indole-3-glycerol phosphate synthase TrpC [Bacilli bacterium]